MLNFRLMKYIFLLLISFLVFFSSIDLAFAQENPPLARWELSPTETKLIFADGREARLILGVRKKHHVVSKAVVKENICFPEDLPKNCSWAYELGSYDLSFVWSKHPDAGKLNEVVSIHVFNRKSKLQSTIDDFSIETFLNGHVGLTQNSPVLTCDSDAWLQNFPKTPSQNFLIPTWAYEIMATNPISKKNENLTFFQANDLELKAIGQNSWQIVVSPDANQMDRFIPVTDPTAVYYNSGARQCSIQIRLEKAIINTVSIANSQPVEKTYSFPLPRSIPKNLLGREVFFLVTYLTRPTNESSTVQVE